MLKKYSVELEGQIEFYEQYLKIVNPELTFDEMGFIYFWRREV